MDGKKVHINRMILVDQKYRNHGLGTFLLKNSIEDAVRDGCDAFYFPVAGPAAIKCADRLKLVTQNALDISEEEPEFKGIIVNHTGQYHTRTVVHGALIVSRNQILK